MSEEAQGNVNAEALTDDRQLVSIGLGLLDVPCGLHFEMEALGELGVLEDGLLESDPDLIQMVGKVVLVLGACHQLRCLSLQLVHLGQEASVLLDLITAEVHLSKLETHALKVKLCLLLASNLVLQISESVAVTDLFLLDAQESNEKESQCHAQNEEHTQRNQR